MKKFISGKFLKYLSFMLVFLKLEVFLIKLNLKRRLGFKNKIWLVGQHKRNYFFLKKL